MKTKFTCSCTGHILEASYYKRDKHLTLMIRDRYSKKVKYKIKGWMADVILFEEEFLKFKKFISKIEIKL